VFKPVSGPAEFSEPKDAEYRAWKRFVDGDAVFGRLDGSEPAADVASPQLADARRVGRYVVRRLP
jgi:hypothetical protein